MTVLALLILLICTIVAHMPFVSGMIVDMDVVYLLIHFYDVVVC